MPDLTIHLSLFFSPHSSPAASSYSSTISGSKPLISALGESVAFQLRFKRLFVYLSPDASFFPSHEQLLPSGRHQLNHNQDQTHKHHQLPPPTRWERLRRAQRQQRSEYPNRVIQRLCFHRLPHHRQPCSCCYFSFSFKSQIWIFYLGHFHFWGRIFLFNLEEDRRRKKIERRRDPGRWRSFLRCSCFSLRSQLSTP